MMIIAGLGHCGTSLVAGAFRNRKHMFSRRCPNIYSDPSLFPEKIVKTHSTPPKKWDDRDKVIWIFGNPMDIVVSCLGDAVHCRNLFGDHKHMDEIYDRDVMGLENHFDVWYRHQKVNFAILMVPSEFNIEPTMTPLLCISFTRGMVIFLGFMSNAYHKPIPLISEIISGNSDFAE